MQRLATLLVALFATAALATSPISVESGGANYVTKLRFSPGTPTASLPTCNASTEGLFIYDSTAQLMKFCNATTYVTASGTTTTLTAGPIGSSPNGNGLLVTGCPSCTLILEPADGNGNGGALTGGTQSITGNKSIVGSLGLTSTSSTALSINSSGAKLLFDASGSGQLGINVTPVVPSGILYSQLPDNTNHAAWFDGYSGASGNAPTNGTTGRTARGTVSSPAALQLNDQLWFFSARGYDGSSFTSLTRATIQLKAAENWSVGSNGTKISFYTTPLGGTTAVDNVDIGPDGSLAVVGAISGSNLSGTNTGDQALIIGTAGSTPTANGATASGMTFTAQPADSSHLGFMPSAAYGRLINVWAPAYIKTDAWSGNNTSATTATGTLWLESLSVTVPCTASGVNYALGGTVGGNVMVSLYGSSQTSGRWAGVSTYGTADGANLIIASLSTAESGTTNRGQIINFNGTANLNPGQYYLGMEFDGTSGTYGRLANTSCGSGCMKTMTHTYGTAASSLSSTSENATVNGFPLMMLTCAQTQLAFP